MVFLTCLFHIHFIFFFSFMYSFTLYNNIDCCMHISAICHESDKHIQQIKLGKNSDWFSFVCTYTVLNGMFFLLLCTYPLYQYTVCLRCILWKLGNTSLAYRKKKEKLFLDRFFNSISSILSELIHTVLKNTALT